MDSPMPSISANADTSFGDRSNIFDQSIGEDDNAALLDMPTPTKIFDDDDAQPTMLQNHDDKKNIAEDRNYTGHGKGRKRPFSQIEDDTVDDDSPRGKELATLRTLNNAVKAITANMEQARGNLKQFTATVDQTDDLLNLWINILSQSEHTKRLLENAQWQGGIVDIAISRQIAAQKEREREQRELQLRLADEEKRRRVAEDTRVLPRGRGRGQSSQSARGRGATVARNTNTRGRGRGHMSAGRGASYLRKPRGQKSAVSVTENR